MNNAYGFLPMPDMREFGGMGEFGGFDMLPDMSNRMDFNLNIIVKVYNIH